MNSEESHMSEEPNENPVSSGRKSDGKFAKGNNANPAGRPVGSRNKHLIAVENLLDGEAEKLSRKAIELALAGDTTALRICMERILPPRKDRPLSVDMPEIKSLEDVATALGAIVEHVSYGAITPSEGAAMSGLIQNYSDAIQMTELARRIEALEQKANI
jgi:hypothetical protein